MRHQFQCLTWWLLLHASQRSYQGVGVHHRRELLRLADQRQEKSLTQQQRRMDAWRSWVVTSWGTRLPTALLLVYKWRDDTEELGFTLYKAPLSAASRSFTDRCGWNFSSATHWEKRATLLSTMSEVGPVYGNNLDVYAQARQGWSGPGMIHLDQMFCARRGNTELRQDSLQKWPNIYTYIY